MADSYLFTFYVELRDELSPLELHTLDWLFNDRADRPEQWPDHEFFRLATKPYRLSGNNGFPDGAYVAASWRRSDYPGVFSGVHLTCPNLKLEWFTEYHLSLAKWLASMSTTRGFAGAFKNQDDSDGLPWVLYVYDASLYMHLADTQLRLISVDSNEPYQWP